MKYQSLFAVLFIFVLVQGCLFKNLQEELDTLALTFVVAGKVVKSGSIDGPVFVVMEGLSVENSTIRQVVFPESTGDFSFLVPRGKYSLAAFEDGNSNLLYDVGEPAGQYGAPGEVIVPPSKPAYDAKPVRNIVGLEIVLQSSISLPEDSPILEEINLQAANSLIRLGTIAQIDDSIFAEENGFLGYWKPATFLKDLGFGVYFLEPYDPAKIPIVFVHGAVGTPVGFKKMAAAIDRGAFQPWFFYYPSGVRLNKAAEALNVVVGMLHRTYGFKSLVVTAHSMGGLVSRAFILKNACSDNPVNIRSFISISTPWGGSRMAAKGVKNAPVAVPSWHDMAPDSRFLQDLYASPLPSGLGHYLLFGYKGDCSLFMANNDGSVELESLLDNKAQSASRRVSGFYEDHTGILASRALIDEYNLILHTLLQKEYAR